MGNSIKGSMECAQCDEEFDTYGRLIGDGWNEPIEFIPVDEDRLCNRCTDGDAFTITLSVVGYENFSELSRCHEWSDLLGEFDSVYLKEVKIERTN